MILTDRTRTVEYQRCPRARFWHFEYAGRGIVPVKISLPLTVGICTHSGLACLLNGLTVETAVGTTLALFEELTLGQGLEVEGNTVLEYAYAEQKALLEALIRGYHARHLPRLLKQYRVVDVEREETHPLVGDLFWMSRADALLQDRNTEDLEVLSWKTRARWDERELSAALHDMQGLSEAWGVEQRLGQLWRLSRATSGDPIADPNSGSPDFNEWLVSQPSPPKIYAIHMEFLLKGDRRENEESGNWVQHSPLIRGYRRTNAGLADPDYAWSQYWTCREPHPMRKSRWYPTGRCEGGRKHRLGEDWEPFNVWEDSAVGRVAGWIDLLKDGKVQPEAGDCLEAQVIVPPSFYRHQVDMDEWQHQTAWQEQGIARFRNDPQEQLSRLSQNFPRYTHSCDYPSKCPYQALCFGSNPPERGELPDLYDWRKPHHEAEQQNYAG